MNRYTNTVHINIAEDSKLCFTTNDHGHGTFHIQLLIICIAAHGQTKEKKYIKQNMK